MFLLTRVVLGQVHLQESLVHHVRVPGTSVVLVEEVYAIEHHKDKAIGYDHGGGRRRVQDKREQGSDHGQQYSYSPGTHWPVVEAVRQAY